MTHRKKQGSDHQQPKLVSKISSMKEKTPTKSQKNIEVRNNMTYNKTPTKGTMNETKIRK